MPTAWTTWSGCGGRTGRCPRCGQLGGWRLGDGRFRCAACRSCTSVTAGTIFDRTRTPLTVWFMAIWLFATQKDGVSAQSVQRALEISSYQTAWAMLHRVRSVLVRPGRERLTGTVEVDETFIGGEEPRLRGGRARGRSPCGRGRRGQGAHGVRSLPDGDPRRRLRRPLHPFVTTHVEVGATVITDAWPGYSGINEFGYSRDRRSQRAARLRGDDPFTLLPGVRRVASLASGGCWGPTRAQSTRHTFRATSTSSCSASTAAPPTAEALSSTGCSNSPSAMNPSATADLIVNAQPNTTHPLGEPAGVTHPASTARRPTVHGEPPDLGWSGQWIPHRR